MGPMGPRGLGPIRQRQRQRKKDVTNKHTNKQRHNKQTNKDITKDIDKTPFARPAVHYKICSLILDV